jgi:hypothetical protein
VNASVLAVATLVLICGCKSSNSDECSYSGGQWECPAGDTYPNCPAEAGAEGTCDYDGGSCFTCYFSNTAGLTCACVGGLWTCAPTETACSGGP